MSALLNAWGKFRRAQKKHGLGHAINATYRKLTYKAVPSEFLNENGKLDFITRYNRILGAPHGDKVSVEDIPKNTMQWVIPNFGFGSGGHLNIFRFMNMMAARGYQQRLVILPPYDWKTAEDAKAAAEEWYFPLNAEVALGIEGFAPSEITIATGWQTAYWVKKFRASVDRFYFVQDFEPYFHAVSSEYYITENTYKLGLKGITAGTWLSEKLSNDYGMDCAPVSFGVEHDAYYPRPSQRDDDDINILFYSRHVTPRRLFELGLTALDIVCKSEPRVTVTFVGGDVAGVDVPFRHTNLGEQSLSALPDLYSNSDIAFVLSGTNLSLVPLEVAACGCPLVLNEDACAKWLLPDDAAYYAPTDPEAMAETLLEAVRNPAGRRQKAENAKTFASLASWEDQGDTFLKQMERLRANGEETH